MAAAAVEEPPSTPSKIVHGIGSEDSDVFADSHGSQRSHHHRFSSSFGVDPAALGNTSSPSQVKRSIEAYLQETDRRLLDTQNLGNSLLKQREDLTSKLQEVEQHQDEAEIPDELRVRLADIEREHNDVGREVARALIAPKQKPEDTPGIDRSVFTSQASSSPTKISAPNRRQRNQPSTRAGDLQFAADISTSLLAQVRQLQAAVSERDDAIRNHQTERERLEQDALGYTQRLRSLDESEQRYKDENWSLETQNHELLNASQEAKEREKKLNSNLSTTLTEKNKIQNDLEEVRLAYGKLSEEHTTVRKAHDTEIHSLKRNADVADSERQTLQSKIDELIAQNQELAKAMSSRSRSRHSENDMAFEDTAEGNSRDFESPDHSPPPSPTKGTPRHGGLESETLKSSLHHAHRMIQNLKGNIHREKTEKIELKRMLQEARDELEQRRGGDSGSGNKRLKTKPEPFKKPGRPDMLGGNRQARTDIEMNDDEWEDHDPMPGGFKDDSAPETSRQRATDTSDAYQTATETEGAFDTADEQATESEAFMTGAESLAGDSTDDLTETEDTAPRNQRTGTVRASRTSMAAKHAGDRSSWLSTASTSADEDIVDTPPQTSFAKFKLKNNRQTFGRQSREPQVDTPESTRTQSTSENTPSTVTGRSPPAGEQSLFAELGEMDDGSSDIHSTPARSSIASQNSTPGIAFTTSKAPTHAAVTTPHTKPEMTDSGMMTEPWQPTPTHAQPVLVAPDSLEENSDLAPATQPHRAPSPSDFPLPPIAQASPVHKTDSDTQYTPQRGNIESSPRHGSNFITPPKTVWDEIHESATPYQSGVAPDSTETTQRALGFSGLLSQNTEPLSLPKPIPAPPVILGYSSILSQVTEPVKPVEREVIQPLQSEHEESKLSDSSDHSTTDKAVGGAVAGGILASAAVALGFSKTKTSGPPDILEDETSEPTQVEHESNTAKDTPLKDISGNATVRRSENDQKEDTTKAALPFSGTDQSSQTMLTAEQIEEALKPKKATPAPISIPAVSTGGATKSPVSPTRYPGRPASRGATSTSASAAASIQRPSSAASVRTAHKEQHPPLPSDHKDVIARVNNQSASPAKRESGALKPGAVMGPPTMPASAMRRPKTPSESIKSPQRDGRASAASRHYRADRATMNSQLSRRSSVSSFETEIDERFNSRPEHSGVNGYEATPGSDPRMIQAITQTMIGEFLWKYTRKTGGKEMSNTRHRRYFWVHPYTKTLYWSQHDPQTAGRNEIKAKSVAIESVRIVNDENPMPPGLHRRSLEVTTPGRVVKFTASTSQRHETWFNALSYLLLRDEGSDGAHLNYATGSAEITNEDLNEFSVGGYGAHLVPGDKRRRTSMSSYNSRTTHGTDMNRISGTGNLRQSMPMGYVATSSTSRQGARSITPRPSSVPPGASRSGRQSRVEHHSRAPSTHTGSVSRLSRMIDSVTGRTRSETPVEPERNETGSIYNASVVSDHHRDSLEEAREEQLRQDVYGGLENVRACCDGKHDVSNLTHRHTHTTSHTQRFSNAINRSMSRRA